MPKRAHSTAAVIVRFCMPARAAPECAIPGMPRDISARILTIAGAARPWSRCAAREKDCIDCSKTSRASRNPPVRLVATTASQPFFEIYASGDGYWPPALLTSKSICLCAATISETIALTPASSRMSQAHQLAEPRSEEHTSELQSRPHLVCRPLLEKKKKKMSCLLQISHCNT